MGLKKKKSLRQSHARFLTYSSICIYSVKRSLEHKYSDFMFLRSFSAAKPCSTNWLLKYFVMMYIAVRYEHSGRAPESWGPPDKDLWEGSPWMPGIGKGFLSFAQSMVLLSVHPVPFPGRNTGSGRRRCFSRPLATWLWFAVEERGKGEREKKKKDWNSKWL